jgi:hypothetical protein
MVRARKAASRRRGSARNSNGADKSVERWGAEGSVRSFRLGFAVMARWSSGLMSSHHSSAACKASTSSSSHQGGSILSGRRRALPMEAGIGFE